jgi:hypothetical protein
MIECTEVGIPSGFKLMKMGKTPFLIFLIKKERNYPNSSKQIEGVNRVVLSLSRATVVRDKTQTHPMTGFILKIRSPGNAILPASFLWILYQLLHSASLCIFPIFLFLESGLRLLDYL